MVLTVGLAAYSLSGWRSFPMWPRLLRNGRFAGSLTIALFGLVIFGARPAFADPGDEPSIISLDFCADQYVLALADKPQVTGLSRGADKDYSFFAERAKGMPRLYGTLDEVLYHDPDVVVQTWDPTGRIKDFAKGRGISVLEADYGSDPEVVYGNVRRIGASFGQEVRAEKFILDYETRLSRLGTLPALPLRAAYVTPSGVTAGSGTFVDQIIQLAGFQSWAAARDLRGWQTLSLEDLVLDPPDIFVTSFFDTNSETQSKWSIARHARLYRMMKERPTIDLPGRYLSCNGLFLTDAAELMRAEANRLLSGDAEISGGGG